MQRILRLTVLVVVCVLFPVFAAAPADPSAAAEATFRAQVLARTTVSGKLTTADLDGDDKQITVQVSWQTQVINQDIQKKLGDQQNRYNQAIQQKNKGNMTNAAQQIQQLTPKLYDTKDTPLDFKFKLEKNCQVRREKLPPKDGGGKYTTEEISKLRAPGGIGYTADLKDLQLETHVKVTIDRAKVPQRKKDEETPPYPVSAITILPEPAAKAADKK